MTRLAVVGESGVVGGKFPGVKKCFAAVFLEKKIATNPPKIVNKLTMSRVRRQG